MMKTLDKIWVCDAGQMPYAEAWTLQKTINAAQIEGCVQPGLILVEHPAVITMGRRSKEEHLLKSTSWMEKQGITLTKTDRGGQMTYHAPGQIVAYPLIHLPGVKMGLHKYLRALESAIIRCLDNVEISATTIEGLTGVWVGDEKIAAIGLRVRRWWTLHGLCLNVSLDLEPYEWFTPCGITDRGVTSMQALLQRDINLEAVKSDLVEALGDYLGLHWERRVSLSELQGELSISQPSINSL